jgi:predicted NAD/FAD-dependent oxidoreductase
MAAIPAHMGQNVLLRLRSAVVGISYQEGWQVTLAGSERLEAQALLLTAPVPESLALLATDGIELTPDEVKPLTRMDYDPCLAVVAVLTRPSQIPPPGGLWPGSARVYWMADNQQKGISPIPAVTIHATPEYSRERWDAESGVIISEMLAAAAPWLGSEVVAASLRRWRYSPPGQLYPARTLLLETPGPLALAGDAFAGPRVEGAALSGMAAGKALAGALRR